MESKADKVGAAVSSFEGYRDCVMHCNYCSLSLAIFQIRKPQAEQDTLRVMCLRLESGSEGKALGVLSVRTSICSLSTDINAGLHGSCWAQL